MIDTIAYILGFLSVPVGICLAIFLFFKLLNKLGDEPADECNTSPAPKACAPSSMTFDDESTTIVDLLLYSARTDAEGAEGAFRCRKALAEKFHNADYYLDYAKDLIEGTFCPRDYEKAKYYLEKLHENPEAHFLLYLIYSASSDLSDDSAIATHLRKAITLNYPEAFTELTHVRNNACFGHARYAYILYEVFHDISVDSFMGTIPKNGMEPIFLESMFWLTIAAGLNHPIGVKFYNSYQKHYCDLEADILPLYLEGAVWSFEQKKMSEFVYFSLEAAIRGHAESLNNIGMALLAGLGVDENTALGELCMKVAAQKIEQN